MTSFDKKLQALGITLPALPTPAGNYLPFKKIGNLLYLPGRGPRDDQGRTLKGRLGAETSIEEGYRHARLAGIGMLAALNASGIDMDRVGVLKLFGMVNATPDFQDHPKVIDGCSDLLIEIFGDNGRHVRSAVGMSSLPHGMTVEIEAVFIEL